ncbi:hypothetical protein BCT94_05630 [Vibrio breoganii]|uniref:hypothetical protein n=1 Tax=Vibrio breoganii TaxID=553239 RepID=UPI000C82C825|nr:hypothetical protein [Vibrio breoganii]PMK31598.1 hypothetical protein BCU03_06955 [Vibrio breoganii]PMK78566.1 hypothetical protein BCT94_05630 [Vibrio breoganii]
MFTLTLDSRTDSRHVGYFKTCINGFEKHYAVEITLRNYSSGLTLLDNDVMFTIETLELVEPQYMVFCELKGMDHCLSQDVVTELGRILVCYGVIDKGTPLEVQVELQGKVHSFVIANAGVSNQLKAVS